MGAPDPRREPPGPGDVTPWRAAVLSLLSLALAFAFARLVPAEVRAVSGTASVVPMASLFGLGLGCLLQERRSLGWLFPGGLGLVFTFVLLGRGPLFDDASRDALSLLDAPALAGPTLRLPLPAAAAAAFVCVAPAFVALGQALARAMARSPLATLGRVLAGGLAATALQGASVLLGLPPWVAITGIAGVASLVLARGRWERGAALAAGLAFLLLSRSPLTGRWSPYSLVQQVTAPGGVLVFANSALHDVVLDTAGGGGGSPPARAETSALGPWRRPHRLFRQMNGRGPESVLVLGSGTGNDVAVALDEGVLRVVAVEIDPVVLDVGRRLNPSAPYSDPRVETVVDDPRRFARGSRETFDVVVFGTPDPRGNAVEREALLPHPRFDHTREALEQARQRLVEEGVLAVHDRTREPRPRLSDTFRSVFGRRSRIIAQAAGAPFGATLVEARGLEASGDGPGTVLDPGGGPPATDDWPYPGAARAGVDPVHLRLLGAAAVLTLGALLVLQRTHPVPGLHLDYFLLGAGSAVLASTASVRLALVLGRTWLVGTLALSAGLLILLLANALVLRRGAPSPALAWTGLLATVLLGYLVPSPWLLALVPAGRTAAVALLLGVPVLCTGLCLSHLLAGEPTPGPPLGMGLVGAMAGLLGTHVSIVIGMRAVWLVALGLLALAWLVARLVHRSAATA